MAHSTITIISVSEEEMNRFLGFILQDEDNPGITLDSQSSHYDEDRECQMYFSRVGSDCSMQLECSICKDMFCTGCEDSYVVPLSIDDVWVQCSKHVRMFHPYHEGKRVQA